MRRTAMMLMLGMCTICCFVPKAFALVQFQKLYVTADTDPEFAKAIKSNATGCYVCHQGKKRTHRNAYGQELDKLLDKKKDIRDTKKIIAALRKVDAIHTDPE